MSFKLRYKSLVNLFTSNKSYTRLSIRDIFFPNAPNYATIEEWDEWYNKAYSESRIKYFIAITLPSIISDVKRSISRPFIKFKVKYVYKDHLINTGLPPEYHEIDTRMLFGMFNLLVMHIEEQKAMMYEIMEDKHKISWLIKAKNFITFSRYKADPENGIKYLEWEMGLDKDPSSPDYSPKQAESAREMYELYNWWKNIRPKQESHVGIYKYNASGYGPIAEFSSRLEQEKVDEDTEMLIRLIKIRNCLWI